MLITNYSNFIVKNNRKKHFKHIIERSSKFCLFASELFYVSFSSHRKYLNDSHFITEIVNVLCMTLFYRDIPSWPIKESELKVHIENALTLVSVRTCFTIYSTKWTDWLIAWMFGMWQNGCEVCKQNFALLFLMWLFIEAQRVLYTMKLLSFAIRYIIMNYPDIFIMIIV